MYKARKKGNIRCGFNERSKRENVAYRSSVGSKIKHLVLLINIAYEGPKKKQDWEKNTRSLGVQKREYICDLRVNVFL